MSDTAALALIFASFLGGFAAYIYCSRWAHNLAIEIITGVSGVSALPLPIEWRWRLLYGRWIYLPISIVGLLAFFAVADMKIADLATDAGVRGLGYFAAAFSLMVAVGYLVHGAIEFTHLRSILRNSTASTEGK